MVRQPHSADSDVLIYTFAVTNGESYELNSFNFDINLSVYDDEIVLYTPSDYDDLGWEFDAREICPPGYKNLDIKPKLTKPWLLCFEVPAGLEPEFVIGVGDEAGHVAQFAADQNQLCLDIFLNQLCADYALDGNTLPSETDESTVLVGETVGTDSGNLTDSNIKIFYDHTTDPVYAGVRAWLIDNESELFYDPVVDLFVMDSPVHVTFQECGQANAFYRPASDSIIMCYELVVRYAEVFRNSSWDTAYGTSSALKWILSHELGHAVIDIFDLDITGQEEDAADQFATVMLMLVHEEEGAHAVQAMAYAYSVSPGGTPAWDTHSLDSQRYYNTICLLYGNHHDDEIGESVAYRIPESRRVLCPSEHEAAFHAWSVLLVDYLIPTDE